MRSQPLVLLLALLPLVGCASLTGPERSGSAVFEVEYANFAWVPTWRGFSIDTTGAIRSFDLKGKPWEPENEAYPTRAELLSKYASNAAPAGTVEATELEAMRARAGWAAGGPLSQPTYRCADAGTITYSVYLYDAEQDAFRRVILRREGDMAQLNQSAAGRAIAEWLISLRLIPTMDGCQP